jgi:hypothetical protein
MPKNYLYVAMYAVNTATGEKYYNKFSPRYYDAQREQQRRECLDQQFAFMAELRHGAYAKQNPQTAITCLLLYQFDAHTGLEEELAKENDRQYILDTLRLAYRHTQDKALKKMVEDAGTWFKATQRLDLDKLPVLLLHLDNLRAGHKFRYDRRIFAFYAKRYETTQNEQTQHEKAI